MHSYVWNGSVATLREKWVSGSCFHCEWNVIPQFILTACITVVIATHVIVGYFGGIVSICDFLMYEHLLLTSYVLNFFLFLPCSFNALVSYSFWGCSISCTNVKKKKKMVSCLFYKLQGEGKWKSMFLFCSFLRLPSWTLAMLLIYAHNICTLPKALRSATAAWLLVSLAGGRMF